MSRYGQEYNPNGSWRHWSEGQEAFAERLKADAERADRDRQRQADLDAAQYDTDEPDPELAVTFEAR